MPKYKVVLGEPQFEEFIIVPVGDDPDGVSWREAKKQLRDEYLNKAASLRELSEKSYFE